MARLWDILRGLLGPADPWNTLKQYSWFHENENGTSYFHLSKEHSQNVKLKSAKSLDT